MIRLLDGGVKAAYVVNSGLSKALTGKPYPAFAYDRDIHLEALRLVGVEHVVSLVGQYARERKTPAWRHMAGNRRGKLDQWPCQNVGGHDRVVTCRQLFRVAKRQIGLVDMIALGIFAACLQCLWIDIRTIGMHRAKL